MGNNLRIVSCTVQRSPVGGLAAESLGHPPPGSLLNHAGATRICHHPQGGPTEVRVLISKAFSRWLVTCCLSLASRSLAESPKRWPGGSDMEGWAGGNGRGRGVGGCPCFAGGPAPPRLSSCFVPRSRGTGSYSCATKPGRYLCRANWEQISQSNPDSGLGFQVQVLKPG